MPSPTPKPRSPQTADKAIAAFFKGQVAELPPAAVCTILSVSEEWLRRASKTDPRLAPNKRGRRHVRYSAEGVRAFLAGKGAK